MTKLDKRLLVNLSKTTAATALLSAVPFACCGGILHITGILSKDALLYAMISVVVTNYWLYFKRGRNFKQSFEDGTRYFDNIKNKFKSKSR